MLKQIKMRWTGIRPLVVHNGLLADPTNHYTVRMKEITGKKKKTQSDFEAMARIEWEGGWYWNEKDGPVMPSDNVERCIQLGAQKKRIGKDVQAAVFCADPEYKIQYDGTRNMEKMWEDGRFQLRKGVAVQRNRVIRSRPMIPTGWIIEPVLEYDDSIVDQKSLLQACEDSGTLIGLGDWRPKFGRFMVEVL